jgi:chemotaxis protein MotB
MITEKKTLLMYCAAFVVAASCVSQKKYDELQGQHNACLASKNNLAAELDGCRKDADAKAKQNLSLQNRIDSQNDSIHAQKNNYAALQNRYADLAREQETIQRGSRAEIRTLMEELQQNRQALQQREDQLSAAEQALNERRAATEKLERYAKQQQEKVEKFERMLREKDSTAAALRQTINEALLGFADKGISVQMRNGKVYVSMEEKLLFASGSFVVDKQGAAALKNLADVLEKNGDINVLIEGHTDDVPYSGSGQLADNWDLSCKRATSVVRILLAGRRIVPSRITAAGRAEFLPLSQGKTPQDRAANRRIEVVLSPKLDEVLKILDNN